jgi:hypothetical protein
MADIAEEVVDEVEDDSTATQDDMAQPEGEGPKVFEAQRGLAINELLVRTLAEMKMARAKLEVEESGRAIASLQGHLAGYRTLVDILAAEFHLLQFMIDDTGDVPMVLPDLDEASFEALRHDVETLRISDAWKALEARVEGNKEIYKNYLLFSAEKTRDLDLKQGQYQGQTIYVNFFNAVEEENQRRRREEEKAKKDKAESLDFGDEAGEKPADPNAEAVESEEVDEEEADEEMETLDPLAEPVQASAAQ